MKKLGLGLAVLAMSAASTAFAASAGVITFKGELVDGTCTPDIGGGTSGRVDIDPVLKGLLDTAGNTAGETAFKITLTGDGCGASGGKIATPFFENNPAKVNGQGRLINTEDPGAGGADKIDVQLLTNTGTPIDITKPSATQETSAAVVVSPTSNDFNYSAQYYATDVAEAGVVTADVEYNIFYK